jgi:drug/metabolite transporter (DMT)-like permease
MNNEAALKNKQTQVPYKILAIPAFFHALCSFSGYASYYYMQASISMMMGGSLSIITAFFSYLVFGSVLSRY